MLTVLQLCERLSQFPDNAIVRFGPSDDPSENRAIVDVLSSPHGCPVLDADYRPIGDSSDGPYRWQGYDPATRADTLTMMRQFIGEAI